MPSALMEEVRGRYAPSGLYVLWPCASSETASERFARHVALRWEKAAEAFLESMASLQDQARPEDLPEERATPKRRRKKGETSAAAHAAASFGTLPAPGVTEQGPGSKAKTSSRPCVGTTESRSVESRAGQELSVPELRGACPEKSEPGEEAERRGEGPVGGKRKVAARQSPGPATPVPSGLDDPEAGGPEAALAFTPGPLAAPKESLPGEWGVPIVRGESSRGRAARPEEASAALEANGPQGRSRDGFLEGRFPEGWGGLPAEALDERAVRAYLRQEKRREDALREWEATTF